jgi:hypothetical protein
MKLDDDLVAGVQLEQPYVVPFSRMELVTRDIVARI